MPALMLWLLACSLLCIILASNGELSEVTIPITFNDYNCSHYTKGNLIDTFYINLDRSIKRKEAIERHLTNLGLTFQRVRAYSLREFIIPPDIVEPLESKTGVCIAQTKHDPDSDSKLYSFVQKGSKQRKAYVRGACGVPGNGIKELITVASHLLAIHTAVYSTSATGKYALIVEDDVWTPFDINFEELIESLPTVNFGIIQLMNSKPVSFYEMLERYKRFNLLWYDRVAAHDARFLPTYSTGAYIINREVLKPIIDQLIYQHANGWMGYSIMAATNVPVCRPALCCEKDGIIGQFNFSLPNCIWAPVGFSADSFLYAMTKTFAFSLPVFLDGSGADHSTIHQDHVIYKHRSAFQKMREIAVKMLSAEFKLPHFISAGCVSNKLHNLTLDLPKDV